jgi:hypothetical protein
MEALLLNIYLYYLASISPKPVIEPLEELYLLPRYILRIFTGLKKDTPSISLGAGSSYRAVITLVTKVFCLASERRAALLKKCPLAIIIISNLDPAIETVNTYIPANT